MKPNIKSLDLTLIIVIISSLIFSFWLMFHTFSYRVDSLVVASKVWSDFASQIPLIRSFSIGSNFPVEHPLFPGEPIRYHFFFYALVGLLERLGLRIDFAFNIPSAFSFTALLTMIYLLAKKFFQSQVVGVLSVIFFLFNGSLSFLEFFRKHPLSSQTPQDILTNTTFPSFGPWDGKNIAAFWNLNIYTNQRHLAFSFALVLLTIYLLFDQKKRSKLFYLLPGVFAGILLFSNQAAFFIDLLFIGWLTVLNIKKMFFPALIILLIPMLLLPFSTLSYILNSNYLPADVFFKVGFLIKESPNFFSLFRFWADNIGLYLLLIPLGFLIAPFKMRLLAIPLIILFVIPNTWQLSKDMINNHKFFNFFLILGSMYAANLLVKLWQTKSQWFFILNKFFVMVLFFGLIFSGIIDFMPVVNDYQITIPDFPASKTVRFIESQTAPKSVFLNSNFLYNPASIAGRPVFLGYPYFLWSYGYDYNGREQTFLSIYRATSKMEVCSLLQQNKISYIELNDHPEEYIKPNWDLWKNQLTPIFRDEEKGISIYRVSSSCLNY